MTVGLNVDAAEISVVAENDPLTEATHELVWPTVRWATYTVEFADDAGGPWIALTTAIKGDGTLFRYSFGTHGDSRLFRVRSESIQQAAPDLESFSLIPAGEFRMGDSFGEGRSDEFPVHEVFVSTFYMGRTEVTWAQWQEVRDWAMDHGYTMDSGSGKADTHPVHGVNWYDTVKWCNALSEREGLEPVYRLDDDGVYRSGDVDTEIRYGANGYRLPSEAEWEKAARGGLIDRRFPWGDIISHDWANYHANSPGSGPDYDKSDGVGDHPDYEIGGGPSTSPVGAFPPNGYGLYELAGNVSEWVNDWYGLDYYSMSPERDPLGALSGTHRMVRGGSEVNRPFAVRVAIRLWSRPSYRGYLQGFRLARSF